MIWYFPIENTELGQERFQILLESDWGFVWWLKSSGQNAAEGKNGATNTPWALDSLSCFMAFGIRCIGGTK